MPDGVLGLGVTGARITVDPVEGSAGLKLVTCEGIAHTPPLPA
jgi:hypothetical protein